MVRNAENLEEKKGEELQRIRTENTVRHGTKCQEKKKKSPALDSIKPGCFLEWSEKF